MKSNVIVVVALGLLALLTTGTGCGDTLGARCEEKTDCNDGQVCASPACDSSRPDVCFYTCETDDECVEKAGSGSHCVADPLGFGCIGYCSAAD
jgi:hypothetical protein